jgi:hypothetical protein
MGCCADDDDDDTHMCLLYQTHQYNGIVSLFYRLRHRGAERRIFKYILKTQHMDVWTGFIWLRTGATKGRVQQNIVHFLAIW